MPRERLVRRFLAFTGEYPWAVAGRRMWMSGSQSLTGEQRLAPSTIRGYQTDLRLFSEYLCRRALRVGGRVREGVRAGRPPGADLP